MDFLGRSLEETLVEKIPAGTLERLEKLWSWRLECAQHADDSHTFTEELAAFGRWFISKKWSDSWLLQQLHEALM